MASPRISLKFSDIHNNGLNNSTVSVSDSDPCSPVENGATFKNISKTLTPRGRIVERPAKSINPSKAVSRRVDLSSRESNDESERNMTLNSVGSSGDMRSSQGSGAATGGVDSPMPRSEYSDCFNDSPEVYSSQQTSSSQQSASQASPNEQQARPSGGNSLYDDDFLKGSPLSFWSKECISPILANADHQRNCGRIIGSLQKPQQMSPPLVTPPLPSNKDASHFTFPDRESSWPMVLDDVRAGLTLRSHDEMMTSQSAVKSDNDMVQVDVLFRVSMERREYERCRNSPTLCSDLHSVLDKCSPNSGSLLALKAITKGHGHDSKTESPRCLPGPALLTSSSDDERESSPQRKKVKRRSLKNRKRSTESSPHVPGSGVASFTGVNSGDGASTKLAPSPKIWGSRSTGTSPRFQSSEKSSTNLSSSSFSQRVSPPSSFTQQVSPPSLLTQRVSPPSSFTQRVSPPSSFTQRVSPPSSSGSAMSTPSSRPSLLDRMSSSQGSQAESSGVRRSPTPVATVLPNVKSPTTSSHLLSLSSLIDGRSPPNVNIANVSQALNVSSPCSSGLPVSRPSAIVVTPRPPLRRSFPYDADSGRQTPNTVHHFPATSPSSNAFMPQSSQGHARLQGHVHLQGQANQPVNWHGLPGTVLTSQQNTNVQSFALSSNVTVSPPSSSAPDGAATMQAHVSRATPSPEQDRVMATIQIDAKLCTGEYSTL